VIVALSSGAISLKRLPLDFPAAEGTARRNQEIVNFARRLRRDSREPAEVPTIAGQPDLCRHNIVTTKIPKIDADMLGSIL
jgi:hypothetical protein